VVRGVRKVVADIDWVEVFASVRGAISKIYPYFRRLCFSIEIVPPDKATAEDALPYGRACLAVITADWRLYLNPTLLSKVISEFQIDPHYLSLSLWLHEIFHILRRHLQRGEGKTPFLWNIAVDCEENDDLIETLRSSTNSKLLQPILDARIIVLPSMLGFPDGLSAEEYYALLLKEQQMLLNLLSAISEQVGLGKDLTFSFDALKTDDDEVGEKVLGRRGVDEISQHAILHATAKEILNHAKNIGTVPGGLLRWAQGMLKSKVNWREVLRRKVGRRAQLLRSREGDFSFLHPHRLSLWHNKPPIILPSIVAPQLNVAIVIDTSGSMSDEELEQAVAEVRAITRSGGYITHIISCDVDVHKVEKVWGSRLPHEALRLVGGGGTNMVAGLRWVQENIRPRPLAIVITDGHTPWDGAENITIPVICCLVGKRRASPDTVPQNFEVVEIEGGEEDGDS